MKQTLTIHELIIPMHIGVNEWEKSILQPITFSISMELAIADALQSDDLRGTIDYTKVASIVSDVANRKHFNLVEHLAYEVHQAIKSISSAILSVKVIVKKRGVIPQSDFIEFVLED